MVSVVQNPLIKSGFCLGLWELGKAFPKHCYHAGISAFLGYDLFS